MEPRGLREHARETDGARGIRAGGRTLAVARIARREQRVRRLHAFDEHCAAGESHERAARDARLARGEERLEIALERIVEEALMEAAAVDVAEMVLPETLLFGEDQLLELAVRVEQDLRRRRLERDASLDAEHRVAEVVAAADAELAAVVVQALDQVDRRHAHAVDRDGNARFERDLDARVAAAAFRPVPRFLGERLRAVAHLRAADREAPEPRVDRVAAAGRRDRQVMLLEPGALRLAARREVADR